MASQFPVCLGKIVLQATGPFSPFQCWKEGTTPVSGAMGDGVWEMTPPPSPATDFQGLIDLLSFDPELCGQLIGMCLVIFIIGYAGGRVARILSRR